MKLKDNTYIKFVCLFPLPHIVDKETAILEIPEFGPTSAILEKSTWHPHRERIYRL